MTRRRATILLHWSVFLLAILIMATSTPLAALNWAFAICGLAMVAIALVKGLMGGPGPKLQGALRTAHPWMHRALYAGLAYASVAAAFFELDRPLPGPELPRLMFFVISVASLHGIFHLWRHTALGDGALRRMTPKAVHGIL
ncbi:hypothetical protein [Thalassococcus sp. S3]|uniref:hypothetical protein n=1 Tax=Thalassococcus sp. S3 TaxID=2017482 RepID=UPI0010243BB8|nr:hypothetical protein [Thalassococcus sp. S3]QBF31114.1 hypothetical protein CFI11_07760 [Thalassococcus sp. S3]